MILGIHGSTGVTIQGGESPRPYVTPSAYPTTVEGRPCYPGDVRYMNGSYQIFNNGYWISVSTKAQITLSGEVETILSWARMKMEQDYELERLMREHQSIKDTKLQLDVLVALLKDRHD